MKLDLRPTEVRNEFGLQTGTVSQPYLFPSMSPAKKQRQEHRALDATRQLIFNAVADCGRLSRLDICRLIHRAKTPHLVAQIEQMVKEGYLVRYTLEWRGVVKYEYEVNR